MLGYILPIKSVELFSLRRLTINKRKELFSPVINYHSPLNTHDEVHLIYSYLNKTVLDSCLRKVVKAKVEGSNEMIQG